jgi:hypothetical protein
LYRNHSHILQPQAIPSVGTILGIGPLSPLAGALVQDKEGSLKGIGALCLQGKMQTKAIGEGESKKVRVTPDDRSYNFREHMGAAEHVFEELQDMRTVHSTRQ